MFQHPLSDSSDSSDKRLAVTKELLRTEDVFLSNVQLLIENYCEPLRCVS